MCFGGNPQPSIAPQPAAQSTVVTPIGDTGQNTAAIAKKRRSLLSLAGGSGDGSAATVGSGGAVGKATLGS